MQKYFNFFKFNLSLNIVMFNLNTMLAFVITK